MSPSIFPHERRPKKDKYAVVEWLFLIALVIGAVLFIWDLVRFSEVEAAPVVDDVFLCGNLENYDIEGNEAEILAYCNRYAK